MSKSTGEEEESVWSKSEAEFVSKPNSKYFDPCQEVANRSLKCLRRNGGDRTMCQEYFDAYKDCKKSWIEEMKERKRQLRREAREGKS